MIDAFWTHAQTYYANPDGTPGGELDNFRLALRRLNRLYGPTPASEFVPLRLKAVRDEMLKPHTVSNPRTKRTRALPDWSRTYTNRQVARLKQVFKWAAENELVPPSVHHGLVAVAGLRKGRGGARETAPVRPAPDADVEAVMKFLSPPVKAIVQLQRLTGMRSSEVCMMRTGDIDRIGDPWVYKPAHHKTEHHGHEREVYLNRQAQEIVQPFLKLDRGVFLFSPRVAEAWRREQQRIKRKTSVQPSQVARAQRSAGRGRRRPPGEQYDREAYRKCIARACERAGVPVWYPQLRHSFATEVRKHHGIETARILLGQKSPAMTLVYAEADRSKAMRALRAVASSANRQRRQLLPGVGCGGGASSSGPVCRGVNGP